MLALANIMSWMVLDLLRFRLAENAMPTATNSREQPLHRSWSGCDAWWRMGGVRTGSVDWGGGGGGADIGPAAHGCLAQQSAAQHGLLGWTLRYSLAWSIMLFIKLLINELTLIVKIMCCCLDGLTLMCCCLNGLTLTCCCLNSYCS